jgi:bis(5'-nucleosyl)-tetraphosphatase (symmetrical)
MEFREKRGPEHAPEGFLPWFAQPSRQSARMTVVCGHWSTHELLLAPNVLMLDSGCLWGGTLTGVRLDDRQVLQVPSRHPVQPKPFG